MLSTKRNGTALLTAPFQSGYLYPTHDMTRLITHSFPSLNSKNNHPFFSLPAILSFKKNGTKCVGQRTFPKITYFYLYDTPSQKVFRIPLLSAICVNFFVFTKSLKGMSRTNGSPEIVGFGPDRYQTSNRFRKGDRGLVFAMGWAPY